MENGAADKNPFDSGKQMVRKSSGHGRRKSSAVASLAHVMESENEHQEEPLTAVVMSTESLAETATLEAARDARFHEAERELQRVLDTDGVSDHVHKRQITRLFDRFRFEYTQLSLQFRENLRLQQKLMEKCLELKNELVMGAIRFKTAKQLQDEEMKNLVFYRDECEHAWKATSVCEERERDAMRIIDELKSEIDDLQTQVKALLGLDANQRHQPQSKSNSSQSLVDCSPSLSFVRSPLKKFLPAASSPNSRDRPDVSPLLSFDDWKISTRVSSPPVTTHKTSTPTQEELSDRERKLEMARCVSVPTLQPTAMERAATAVANASPSRRHQQRIGDLEPRRATTSLPTKRSSPQLPRVSTRNP